MRKNQRVDTTEGERFLQVLIKRYGCEHGWRVLLKDPGTLERIVTSINERRSGRQGKRRRTNEPSY